MATLTIEDALARAAAAEAIANKALQIAIDALAEIRSMRHLPAPQYVPADPFSLDMKEAMREGPMASIPNGTVAPRKISPFRLEFGAGPKQIQTIEQANAELEKGISDEEALKEQLWDESVGGEV